MIEAECSLEKYKSKGPSYLFILYSLNSLNVLRNMTLAHQTIPVLSCSFVHSPKPSTTLGTISSATFQLFPFDFLCTAFRTCSLSSSQVFSIALRAIKRFICFISFDAKQLCTKVHVKFCFAHAAPNYRSAFFCQYDAVTVN